MNMHRHLKSDTTSLATGFLLLVMVVSVLTIDLYEVDAMSGYDCHRALYRMELVFNAEFPSQPPVLSISEDIPGNDLVKDCILRSHFYATDFGTALFVIQSTGQVNIRPFYSSHNPTTSFNVPHQNSDEDEVFILPVDVA